MLGSGPVSGCSAIPVIAVADPRKALGDLAAAVRKLYQGRVVGVTGSNGKTTTKELARAALSAAGPTHGAVARLLTWEIPLDALLDDVNLQ